MNLFLLAKVLLKGGNKPLPGVNVSPLQMEGLSPGVSELFFGINELLPKQKELLPGINGLHP
jgi:hypothetical protein